MRLSLQWLREWVDVGDTARELADRLTLAGLEVGSVEAAAPALEHVVVGEVLEMAPHPAADKLRVCQVAAGKHRVQVVCGAPNVRVGMKAPLALPGAVLPGDKRIGEAQLRGVPSAGMLCSAVELGLGEEGGGLLELDPGARQGQALTKYLATDDAVLDVELTPNRGDCLGVGGLAREVAALTGVRMHPPAIAPVRAATRRALPVDLRAGRGCTVYCGRVVSGIDPRARTPDWLRERLRRAGQRCIHPVVDVTNYVMFELGQPMHAFDLARVDERIVVRPARAGESLELLDGSRAEPPAGTLLIADRRRPLALAGIMGGQDSAVGEGCTDIFFESAWFDPDTIRASARALGLQTDSSYRFERGVDPTLQRLAIERATALLCAIAGGRPGPVTVAVHARHRAARRPVRLRHDRLERLLGMPVPARDARAALARLGMGVAAGERADLVTPPPHRFDIERECDLVEEVARLIGYDRIPARPPLIRIGGDAGPGDRVTTARLRDLLVDRDYQEVVTFSFVDPDQQAAIDPQRPALPLANPLSRDMSVMRTSLWPGLLKAVRHNLNRQHRRVRVFEIGRAFIASGRDLAQPVMLAGAVSGPALPVQWDAPGRPVDVFDVKADLEALAALGGGSIALEVRPAAHPALHPAQSGELWLDGRQAGYLGVLHPAVSAALDLPQAVVVFELLAETLQNGRTPSFREISRFPSIRRDLAVWVAADMPAAEVQRVILETAGAVLTKLELFDAYRGEGIDSQRKSLAFSLTLQDSSRTLRDEEIDRILEAVRVALRGKLSAEPRS